MFFLCFRFLLCILLGLTIVSGCKWPASDPTSAEGESPRLRLPEARGTVSFVTDYAEGLELAQQWEKPVLLFFTASWCPFSQQMLQQTFRDPQVARLSKQFICIHVDVEQNPIIARNHQVRAVPTVQILSPRRVLICRLNGYLSAQEAVHHLQQSVPPLVSRPQGGASVR